MSNRTGKTDKKEKETLVQYSINKVLDFIGKYVYYDGQDDGEDVALSVLLLGPPGVGKTEGIRQLAKTLAEKTGRILIDLRKENPDYDEVYKSLDRYFVFIGFSVTHVEPTDISGVPRASEGKRYVTYLPPEYVYLLSDKRAAGIVFLDELTIDNRPDRRSAELKILDEKQFGFKNLSRNVLVIAAGNTDQHTSLAEPLPDPLLRGRVLRFYVKPPTVHEWIEYMTEAFGDRWDKRVAGFLMRYPDSLWVSYEGDAGYDPRLSPRTWTKLALLLYRVTTGPHSKEDIEMAVSSLVHGSEYSLLNTFLETEVPTLDELRLTPEKWKTLALEAKYLITSMLSQLDVYELCEKYRELLEAMKGDKEFLELLKILMSKERRLKYLLFIKRHLPWLFEMYGENVDEAKDFGLG